MNAIKAFESVVRTGNMVRASEELSVSPSAVSHQIKTLETWFDRPLFDRQGRDLLLNDAGRIFFDLVRPAFEQLRTAASRLTEPPTGRLKVVICPSLASIWFAPRLRNFVESHPEIDVELHCRREIVDLNEADFDCSLRYCASVPENHVGDILMTEDVFPVCAPSLAKGNIPLNSLDDLRHHTLLNDVLGESGVVSCDWASWFSEVGMPQLIRPKGHGFSDSNVMYEAACEGVGVALGRSILVAELIKQGRLVRPLDVSRRSSHSWYFLSTTTKLDRKILGTFRDWLMEVTHLTLQHT
ncbi:LysR substrate-binding domain-containing protein [Kiloniella spongiae]|uniref:LysR substrate-binding domain-containing protein n=1 Tax=Kiloniella spongiae TaxID=1489064 RepID=UPI000699F887|nr:LysR substrate-binding domain-containing protein [Kiloniella spongiae]